MKGRNERIRQYARSRKVKLWQVAEKMGIFDSMLSKKLRHELSAKETEKILAIIDEIANSSKKEDDNND